MNDIDLCLEVVSRSRQPLRYIRHWISRKPLKIEAWFQRTISRKWLMWNQIVTWPWMDTSWLQYAWSLRSNATWKFSKELFARDGLPLFSTLLWRISVRRWLCYVLLVVSHTNDVPVFSSPAFSVPPLKHLAASLWSVFAWLRAALSAIHEFNEIDFYQLWSVSLG